ncbi:HAD family hydrolase [Paenibacillus macquariensis]|uniref:Haloacid dehalogenase superfamily, subfamily IA, variant 3 with third motif having DD or ED/haloacid dehalogenase superfamily, subfamily IA, variant 1 with third motif having Dx(3-4)D or Dx(3-4)E n=1 Tax=Paenibacillus macquariensis TaxID=948756 RepID=A0ABY1JMF5_9BACL|nr:HAD family hydrolase [Paenibacillus macquariensis]MEC0092337.1 HAD family hydrolase [Paenibacillus macquariensis]OAB37124.1 phosphatase [Paenibacillus macquariensis subsp. macquariensis]SIQ45883.1 haloacid dehalogenase superfamily, subfamily IA, variant 3 with third motif having DD or ED/haloacid dehalogenase superfamily, subfamily IA, variant 1 with third motif having Dx(3-4)D or Dx(3-4)E [Paenibacillus macquariensis]
MIKAFIFDMDGVIIDSEPIHFDVDIQTMNYLGTNIYKEELEKYVGMTNPEMWNLIIHEYSVVQSVSEIIDYQLTTKINIIKSIDLEPIAGIREILFELKQHNIPIGLASSSPRKFIEEVLSKFNITEYFDCIVSGEEVNKGKPAPDVYLEAANILGVDPKYCYVLEDSKNGVAAAKAAGMKCIGFINQNSGNQDLSKADYIIKWIKEIDVKEMLNDIT